MNRFFYGKLAWSNLKKNRGLYLPYIITAIGICAMYYIMAAITKDEGIQKMPGAGDLFMILNLGCGVISMFSVIFLFYTNSFLMKRRKKEFGLYNILGMEKRHIGKMMFWETLMVAFVSILCGAAAGILLYKLVALVLLRMTRLEVSFGFHISVPAIRNMVILFIGIFAVTLVFNLFQIGKAKPIELLQSASQGEAEPKTRWLMTLIGILCLGAGYGIAIGVENPLGALMLFFVAVILVIIGTYCLFTAGSVAVLKLLRRNKKYYYKTSHFISTSGMIYRMKQNAVGLANICILSTMVLVMVAGTVALHAGVEDIMNVRYPMEVNLGGKNLTEQEEADLGSLISQAVNETGLAIEKEMDYTALSFAVWKNGESLQVINSDTEDIPKGTISTIEIMTLPEYEKLVGKKVEMEEDEILVYVQQGEKKDTGYRIGEKSYRIKEYVRDMELERLNTNIVIDSYVLIVKNSMILNEIYELQKEVYGENASVIEYYAGVNLSGTEEQKKVCVDRINELIASYNGQYGEDAHELGTAEFRSERKEKFMTFCGGFLFLGILLGFVFLMATVMIIYYKQISEGYEDKARFEIMQKVGMSPKEVKASIRSQILKVFFLPLVMACIHLTAAFPMMNRLLMLFSMNNMVLFAICTAATVGVFAVIYAIVYGITAKSYYKIVG